ncbi:MAG: CvpA family protein, partial [Bacilli bacterium]|nr:CvpA family protein [Bacilli bacterium]
GELVSQFDVSSKYTQINYKDEILRVTPLDYSDVIKYFTNRKSGIPGYVTVNSVTGEAKLVKLTKGMKYSETSLFFENVTRKLRFKYPFEIFGDLSFEIDNNGEPYWIMPTIKDSGVGQREDISGIIILDAITGESKKYDIKDIPTWVDHVYSPNLIIEQVDDWGSYVNGFINTLFGQKGMKMTTDGYNYIAMNDDIYMYTGITSIVSDESNLGFILTNLRTKETKFFDCPGAEEYSAMDSAKGQVQQMNYTSSFPILINLASRPTYVISLKDDAGLVKMYAFVDVADYQKVVVTDASAGIQNAANNYLNNNGIEVAGDNKEITVSDIKTAIIDGNTYYYITDTENIKYRVSIKIAPKKLPFVKIGDKLVITSDNSEVHEIFKLK